MKARGRSEVYTPLAADSDAQYDDQLTIDLDLLEPQIAAPHCRTLLPAGSFRAVSRPGRHRQLHEFLLC